MSTLWSYLWPSIAAGIVIGVIAGLIAPRRSSKQRALAAGLLASILAAAVWHGPLGSADKLAAQVERDTVRTLEYYEMGQVQARLSRDPMTRRLMLSGPADDFQRSELVRVLSDVSGVSRATWSSADRGLPLVVEGALGALAGYLLGLLLAYLVWLHRRYNAQWEW